MNAGGQAGSSTDRDRASCVLLYFLIFTHTFTYSPCHTVNLSHVTSWPCDELTVSRHCVLYSVSYWNNTKIDFHRSPIIRKQAVLQHKPSFLISSEVICPLIQPTFTMIRRRQTFQLRHFLLIHRLFSNVGGVHVGSEKCRTGLRHPSHPRDAHQHRHRAVRTSLHAGKLYEHSLQRIPPPKPKYSSSSSSSSSSDSVLRSLVDHVDHKLGLYIA